MSQKNETTVLVISLAITLGLLGVGSWWFLDKVNNSEKPTSTQPESPSKIASKSLDNRLSFGDKILISQPIFPEKQKATEAFKAGNYQQAIYGLESQLKTNINDPESLIYLNNARIGNNKAYTIAVAAPIGTDQDGAQEILRGVAQVQNEINQQGGIKGTPIKVLIADDDNNPEIAKEIAQSFVKNEDILGVVGHWASDVTLATSQVYNEGKLVTVSPISTSIQISTAGDYIFRTVPSDRFAGSALSRYQINQLKLKKAAVFFNSNSNYSKSLKDEFTTALFADGGSVVAEFDLARANFNAANDLQEATQKGAEVLMLATNTASLDQALQVIQVNDSKLALLGGDDAYTAKTLQIGRQDAVNMVLAVPWHILGNPNAEFPQTSRRLWGGEVSWRTAMAYDAAKALIAAITQNPSREGVQQTLANPNFSTSGASGEIRFLPSGDRNQAVQLVKIVSGNRSGFGYDFVPIP